MYRRNILLALFVSATCVGLVTLGCDNKPAATQATANAPAEPAAAAGSAPAAAKPADGAAAKPAAGAATPAATKAATPTPTSPAQVAGSQPATPAADGAAPAAGAIPAALMDPSKANKQAPEKFTVVFDTTKGEIHIAVTRKWAPLGADRFYNLVMAGWYKDIAFFRVIKGFMGQFGVHGNPAVNKIWRTARIKDDPRVESNKRGYVTFAMGGPNTRTNQIFINFSDANKRLDSMGFSPFGKVVKGMDVVDKLYDGYGEGAPSGAGPSQGLVQTKGNAYLKTSFPKLDYIKSATIAK